LKSSNVQDVFDRGQESEEDVAGEGILGVEEDAVTNIARQIEGEISKYTTLSALPLDNSVKVFVDQLLWWKQNSFQSFQALHHYESLFAFLLKRHQVNGFSAQYSFF
jgi:hypothetical protein